MFGTEESSYFVKGDDAIVSYEFISDDGCLVDGGISAISCGHDKNEVDADEETNFALGTVVLLILSGIVLHVYIKTVL